MWGIFGFRCLHRSSVFDILLVPIRSHVTNVFIYTRLKESLLWHRPHRGKIDMDVSFTQLCGIDGPRAMLLPVGRTDARLLFSRAI